LCEHSVGAGESLFRRLPSKRHVCVWPCINIFAEKRLRCSPALASEVQSLPPLAPMGNSDLLSFAMLMHAGVRDPFYWAAAATPLISSFLARASFSQAKRRSHYTAHHTSIQRWWLKHYSRRRDKLIDYRRQCLQSTRSLPVHVRCVCVCIFVGRLMDKSGTHASRKASFVLPAPMDASMFICLRSLQSGALRSPLFSLQTVHFLLHSAPKFDRFINTK